MHYDRMDVSLRTHDYLYTAMDGFIQRKHHKEFREAQQAAVSGKTGKAAPAAKIDDDQTGLSQTQKADLAYAA